MAKKILVVDDEIDELNTMEVILKKAGFSVTSVTNGAHALDEMNKKRFDAVLTDILMPTLSGYDLLTLMKGKLDPKTKVVFVSVLPKKEVDTNRVSGFVQKPFSPETLVGAVNSVLKE